MKRSIYIVMSYDGKIEKVYRNYKNAYKFAVDLIYRNIDNGIYTYDENGKLYQVIGC